MIPEELRYTAEHEWVRVDGDADDVVTVGITDFAQGALGDIVYVSLPEPGESVSEGSSVGELESTKSVSDVYAPVSGTVAARNDGLEGSPQLVNTDPYGAGWLFEVLPADASGNGGATDALMDSAAYQASLES